MKCFRAERKQSSIELSYLGEMIGSKVLASRFLKTRSASVCALQEQGSALGRSAVVEYCLGEDRIRQENTIVQQESTGGRMECGRKGSSTG
jgi:hypothetical protein